MAPIPPREPYPSSAVRLLLKRVILGAAGLLIGVWLLYTFKATLVSVLATSPVAIVLVSLLIGCAIAYRFRLPKDAEKFRNAEEGQKERDIIVTIFVVAAGLLFGLHIATAAGGFAAEPSRAAVTQIAIGWALGYFGLGFVVGFLFGIPRVLQGEGGRKPSQDNAGYEQRVNTNLEQISDWLTKIIVGLGLVELRAVPGHLHKAAQWMAHSFVPGTPPASAPPEAATSFAGALIVFFSVLGFLGGYLTTRLFLAGAFGRADRAQFVVEEKSVGAIALQDDGEDNDAKKLRNFWKPGDVMDTAHQVALESWLKEKGRTDVKLGDLIFEPEHAGLRKEAVAHFNL